MKWKKGTGTRQGEGQAYASNTQNNHARVSWAEDKESFIKEDGFS